MFGQQPRRRPRGRDRRESARWPRSCRRAAAQGDRPVERGAGRVARIDEHEPTAADEVGVDRLAGDAATGRHDDPGRRRRRRLDDLERRADPAPAGRGSPRSSAACSSCWSVVLVGSHIASRPSAIAASASRRAEPRVRRDLVALERRLRAGRQHRGEEARIEPARHRRRRDPARQRDEQVGPQAQVEVVGERREASSRRGRAPSEPRGSAPRPRLGRADVGEQDAGLLEELADRGDVGRQGRPGREVAAERRGAPRPARGRPRDERRRRASAGSTRPPGKTCTSGANAIVAGRWVSRTSSPAAPGTQQHDGRGGPGLDRAVRQAAARQPWRSPRRAAPGAPRASVTGSRQTKPRQT